MAKPNEMQKRVCEAIIREVSWWRDTNDINSPSHYGNLEGCLNADLDEVITEFDLSVLKAKMANLLDFVKQCSPYKEIINEKDMKVTFEIPNRIVEVARGLMMMQVNGDEEEKEMDAAFQRMKDMQEPLEVSLEGDTEFFGTDLGTSKKQMAVAIACFALCKVLKEADEK